MAKRIVSSIPIHKVKLMKRGKRKKFLLKSVVDYLKSDTYIFAPLLSSKSSDFCSAATVSASSPEIEASEPMLEKKETFLGKMKDYMISDQDLYAPLVDHQPLFPGSISTSSPQDKGPTLFSRNAETTKWKESMKKNSRGNRRSRAEVKEYQNSRTEFGILLGADG